MNKSLALLMLLTLLTACNEGIPSIDDPHNIIVDGQKMKQDEFLEKFCVAKLNNETCLKVQAAYSQDMAKPTTVPRF